MSSMKLQDIKAGLSLSDYVPAGIIGGEARGFGECTEPWPEKLGLGVRVLMKTG